MKENGIGHILRRNCLLKHVTEGRIEVTGGRGRRHKQLLDNLKEMKILETESQSLENSVWKRLRTCRKTDCFFILKINQLILYAEIRLTDSESRGTEYTARPTYVKKFCACSVGNTHSGQWASYLLIVR
jgi:hypothetical protein